MGKKKRTAWQWFVRIIAGYEITIISLLLLLLIVFFSTLEQAETGLYVVKQRYYAVDVWFVQPELRGRLLPLILPGAYWVCVLFTMNLIAGGIVRMAALHIKRFNSPTPKLAKFSKFIGIFIAHMSMAFLMIAGAVDYHLSSLTMLGVEEGTGNIVGESDEDVVIEVSEIVDGVTTNVHVIGNDQISSMILNGEASSFTSKTKKKTFTLKDFPFKLEFEGWYRNARVLPSSEPTMEGDGPVVDGMFIRAADLLTIDEGVRINQYNQSVEQSQRKFSSNIAASYLKVVPDEGEAQSVVLYDNFRVPSTVNVGEKTYAFRISHRRTILPFEIHLRHLEVKKYQGSLMARDYVSNITYEIDGVKTKAKISMNEPLRHSGYTFYQARWDPLLADTDIREKDIERQQKAGEELQFSEQTRFQSVYQVVHNPADKWPEYCVYVCGIGLALHFVIKLVMFVLTSFKRKEISE